MTWWPGVPHIPHRDARKVRSIQRSLDWKRVAHIAAYLLQEEIVDAPERLDRCFKKIYEPKALEPGREWPPKMPRVIGFERSEYPTFSNILIHVNGARIRPLQGQEDGAAKLVFDEKAPDLNFVVIDGQHRVNGAYFAVSILREKRPDAISAVIASNEATLPKFARIGKIAGFGDPQVRLTRIGAVLDLNGMAVSQFSTETEVGTPSESWSTGIWVFHNPQATKPIDPDFFEDGLNVDIRDGQRFYYSTRRSHIIRSKTVIQESAPSSPDALSG